ncbi:MAG: hypothetical protein ABSB82_16210 [Terriglobia bacterium]|jgi:hypothetical protein
MPNNIDFSKLLPVAAMQGDSEDDTALLRGMFEDARAFLTGFDWCRSVVDSFFGIGIGGVVAVFLFKIVPSREGVDENLWVVVGDLPPAYLVTDDSPTPVAALEAYIDEMSAWVEAARRGDSVEELIPVNAPPTPANVDSLEGRLSFLKNRIIPMYATDYSKPNAEVTE